MKHIPFFGAFFLTACVTINIYFPAAAAEKVADEIIRDIQQERLPEGSETQEPEVPPTSDSREGHWRQLYSGVAVTLSQWLGAVIPAAHAAADLSIDSPDVSRLRASMGARFPALSGYYQQGLIGIQANGLLTVRGAVPLQERNKVSKLVAAENADREALYQAIARANGHPEWYDQIKATFAQSWVENAQAGWWFQSANGQWQQK